VLAAEPRHPPVEDVEESGRKEQEPRQQAAVGQQEPSDDHVVQERGQRELPGPDARPIQPEQRGPVGPREHHSEDRRDDPLGPPGHREIAQPLWPVSVASSHGRPQATPDSNRPLVGAVRRGYGACVDEAFERSLAPRDRSYWLRQAGHDDPAPALDERLRVDVAIVGGGYTG